MDQPLPHIVAADLRAVDPQSNPPTGTGVDMREMRSTHPLSNIIGRALWEVVYRVLFRTSPRPLRTWRNFLLRVFGAKIDRTAVIYPTARIWAPWNLTMAPYSCLASDVDCYCVARITIGAHSVISQYTYLCGASHDYRRPRLPLTPAPIVIEDQVWVAADVFVGPGVRIGQGTVVGARSTVVSDLPAWKVCVGTPAKPIKDRVLIDDSPSATQRAHE
jgi:putative colanic acid biosynthesis acetyltransferase WcaF